jgi:hypothetical protein
VLVHYATQALDATPALTLFLPHPALTKWRWAVAGTARGRRRLRSDRTICWRGACFRFSPSLPGYVVDEAVRSPRS